MDSGETYLYSNKIEVNLKLYVDYRWELKEQLAEE